MALALLCSELRRADSGFQLGDTMISSFFAVIVDHGLREGSWQEAKLVARRLKTRLNMKSFPLQLSWAAEFGPRVNPRTLPNLESVARRMRYRAMANTCRYRHCMSLLLAHHEDDQYETVLMRLLGGHGPRGLRGIRAAADIPECYGIHGAWQSGFVDDQKSVKPLFNFRPTKVERRALKRMFLDEMLADRFAHDIGRGLRVDYLDELDDDEEGWSSKKMRWSPPVAPLDVEDAGLMIYRPLLHFSKDRLIATCLKHGVTWVEDETNSDPTLTLRNAVRHLVKNYELPKALQKPAVLQLASNCETKISAQEAEANRLTSRADIRNFSSNAGTLMVRMPDLSMPRVRRRSRYATRWQWQRLEHRRAVAAILIRRMISFASPEPDPTPTTGLQLTVDRIFPALSRDSAARQSPGPLKAFNVCGVHFIPVEATARQPVTWYLSREPYSVQTGVPTHFVPGLRFKWRWRRRVRDWQFSRWPRFELWDGRYWFSICTKLPAGVVVAPFSPQHAKLFRESLSDPAARETLAALLKRHAPGKVRYTLPAIYSVGNIDWALEGQEYWPLVWKSQMNQIQADGQGASFVDGFQYTRTHRSPMPTPDELDGFFQELKWDKANLGAAEGISAGGGYGTRGGANARGVMGSAGGGEDPTRGGRLLALPTLGIHLPGIDDVLQWEFRYRRVDTDVLERRLVEGERRAMRERGAAAAARSPAPRLWRRLNRRKGRLMSMRFRRKGAATPK